MMESPVLELLQALNTKPVNKLYRNEVGFLLGWFV